MDWKRIYEHYDEWDTATVKRQLAAVTGLERADPAELADFANYFADTKAAVEVLKTAVDMGVAFSGADLMEVADVLDDADFTYLLLKSMLLGTALSPRQLLDLDYYVDAKTHALAVQNSLRRGIHLSPQEIIALDGLVDEATMDAAVVDALSQGSTFTAAELVRLDGLVGQKVLDQAALASAAGYSDGDVDLLEDVVSEGVYRQLLGTSSSPAHGAQPAPSRLSNAALALMLTELLSGGKKKKPRFHVGDAVYVKPYSTFGRVIDVNDGLYMVRYTDGKYVSSFAESQLEKG